MDNSTIASRKQNLRFARMYLMNWILSGRIHELEKCVVIIQNVIAHEKGK